LQAQAVVAAAQVEISYYQGVGGLLELGIVSMAVLAVREEQGEEPVEEVALAGGALVITEMAELAQMAPT